RQRVAGIRYRRSIMFASGRFAMLDDGLGFTLVPWKPVIGSVWLASATGAPSCSPAGASPCWTTA
ncbi:hypothetical protein C7E12_23135, partial [Stenotrophomonas maltophilia]